jgi:hypothetical protein
MVSQVPQDAAFSQHMAALSRQPPREQPASTAVASLTQRLSSEHQLQPMRELHSAQSFAEVQSSLEPPHSAERHTQSEQELPSGPLSEPSTHSFELPHHPQLSWMQASQLVSGHGSVHSASVSAQSVQRPSSLWHSPVELHQPQPLRSRQLPQSSAAQLVSSCSQSVSVHDQVLPQPSSASLVSPGSHWPLETLRPHQPQLPPLSKQSPQREAEHSSVVEGHRPAEPKNQSRSAQVPLEGPSEVPSTQALSSPHQPQPLAKQSSHSRNSQSRVPQRPVESRHSPSQHSRSVSQRLPSGRQQRVPEQTASPQQSLDRLHRAPSGTAQHSPLLPQMASFWPPSHRGLSKQHSLPTMPQFGSSRRPLSRRRVVPESSSAGGGAELPAHATAASAKSAEDKVRSEPDGLMAEV